MKYLYFLILSIGLFSYVCGQNNEDSQDENFEYPCSSSDNLESCVRSYFNNTGTCKPVSHEDGDPIYRERKEVYFPKINLTVITTQANITYYNSKIRTFYFNKDTGNYVFAIDFEGVYLYTNYTYFLFHQVAKEPLVSGDFVYGTYPCTLTAIIRNGINAESIEAASVTAYIPTGHPDFVIGPTVTNSTNPVIVNTLKGLLEDVPTAVLEIFLTGAPHFFLVYLQHYICDFGILESSNSNNWGNTIYA